MKQLTLSLLLAPSLLLYGIFVEGCIADTKAVLLKDFVYEPVTLDINEGDTVVWQGIDDYHDVTSGIFPTPNGIFSSPILNHGNAYSFTFYRDVLNADTSLNDTFNYYCQPHASMGMVGTIRVARVAKNLSSTLNAWQSDASSTATDSFACSLTINAPETSLSINCDPQTSLTTVTLSQAILGATGASLCTINGTSGSCPISHMIGDSLLIGETYLTGVPSSGIPIRGQVTKAGGSQAISGKVRLRGIAPIAGVVISDGIHSTTTGADGSYILQGIPNGVYRISATLAGYSMTPNAGVTPFIVNSADIFNRDFTASPSPTSIGVLGDIDGDLQPDPLSLNKGLLSYSSSLTNNFQNILTTTDTVAVGGAFFAPGQTSIATVSKTGNGLTWKIFDTKGALLSTYSFGDSASTPIGGCDFNNDGLSDLTVRKKKTVTYSTDLGVSQQTTSLSAARSSCPGTFFDAAASMDTNADGVIENVKLIFLNGKTNLQVKKKKFPLATGKILQIFGYEGQNKTSGLFYQDDKGAAWNFNFTTGKKTKSKLTKSKKALLVVY